MKRGDEHEPAGSLRIFLYFGLRIWENWGMSDALFRKCLALIFVPLIVCALIIGAYALYVERWDMNQAVEEAGLLIHGVNEQ